MRIKASDCRLAKEYAKNMLNWGTMLHAHNESIQRFMEVRCVIHPCIFF